MFIKKRVKKNNPDLIKLDSKLLTKSLIMPYPLKTKRENTNKKLIVLERKPILFFDIE